jgi:hypothetical protein
VLSVIINIVLICRVEGLKSILRRKEKRLQAVMIENKNFFMEQFKKYAKDESDETFH